MTRTNRVAWRIECEEEHGPCARMTIRDTEKISLAHAQGDTQFWVWMIVSPPCPMFEGAALVNSSCISGLNRCHRALGPSAWWGARRPELVQPAGASDAHYEHSEVCFTKLLGSFFFDSVCLIVTSRPPWESISISKSHSWVRIAHGLNKLVTDLIDKEYDDNEQETSETKTELFELKTEVLAHAHRLKAKAKPSRPTSTCSYTRTVPIRERIWVDIEPGAQSDQAYPVAKKTKHSSSARRITSRRIWSDRILETERWSSEQIGALSILDWWYVEDQDGRRRRQQENTSILYWSMRTRIFLPQSSSRSLRT